MKWLLDPPHKPAWDEIVKPRQILTPPKPYPDLLNEGWDTETKDGKAFIMSNSREWRHVDCLEDCLGFMTEHSQYGLRHVWWNIRYDVTALFKHDHDAMMDLELTGTTTVGDYELYYLPRKLLKIRHAKSKKTYYHYDVAQFYMMPLASAAEKFLGRVAPDIKMHRHELDKYDTAEVGEYCRWDATSTKDLADLYVEKLKRVKLYPRHLISGGNIAQNLQLTHANIHTWRDVPSVANRLGWRAQRGAWIDTWIRGEMYVNKYDIKSAYPANMRDMPDLRDGQWVFDKDPNDAAYSFTRATVQYGPDTLPILPTHIAPTNIYADVDEPRNVILTQDEYRYLVKSGARVDTDLWYSFVPNEDARYPWRDLIDKLTILKDEISATKGTPQFDPGYYLAMKGLINSLYGKTCEKIPQNDGSVKAGRLMNPVCSSHILARTRVQVAEIIGARAKDVAFVATDCVATLRPIPGIGDAEKIGDWELEKEDTKALVFQPGVYEVEGERPHTRGFKSSAIKTLWDVANTDAETFTITIERPYSGRQASYWNKPELANIFDKHDYTINVANSRRLWKWSPKKFSDLLDNQIHSVPVPVSLAESVL